jgi:hypothetical protein
MKTAPSDSEKWNMEGERPYELNSLWKRNRKHNYAVVMAIRNLENNKELFSYAGGPSDLGGNPWLKGPGSALLSSYDQHGKWVQAIHLHDGKSLGFLNQDSMGVPPPIPKNLLLEIFESFNPPSPSPSPSPNTPYALPTSFHLPQLKNVEYKKTSPLTPDPENAGDLGDLGDLDTQPSFVHRPTDPSFVGDTVEIPYEVILGNVNLPYCNRLIAPNLKEIHGNLMVGNNLFIRGGNPTPVIEAPKLHTIGGTVQLNKCKEIDLPSLTMVGGAINAGDARSLKAPSLKYIGMGLYCPQILPLPSPQVLSLPSPQVLSLPSPQVLSLPSPQVLSLPSKTDLHPKIPNYQGVQGSQQKAEQSFHLPNLIYVGSIICIQNSNPLLDGTEKLELGVSGIVKKYRHFPKLEFANSIQTQYGSTPGKDFVAEQKKYARIKRSLHTPKSSEVGAPREL